MNIADAVRKVDFVELVVDEVEHVELSLPFAEQRAHVRWRMVDGGAVEVALAAALPIATEPPGKLRLRPQKGVVAAVDALREIHVDDAAVDAAWVIHGDDPALLIALVPELRALAALAPLAPEVDIDATALNVVFARVTEAETMNAALALWHRAAFFRLGAG